MKILLLEWAKMLGQFMQFWSTLAVLIGVLVCLFSIEETHEAYSKAISEEQSCNKYLWSSEQ